MTPEEALAFTVAFLDTEPDNHALCSAALTIWEPLIDWHWKVIEEAFIAIVAVRPGLRKMVSCCDFDEAVPEAVRDRIYAYVRPQEDIGHGPDTAQPGRRPSKVRTSGETPVVMCCGASAPPFRTGLPLLQQRRTRRACRS
jgi:hypothetical protein